LIIYLAQPYTHPSQKIVCERVRLIREITAHIINADCGIYPLSPISYTHELDSFVRDDHDWYKWDIDFLLEISDGMVVVKMPGWETSKGIKKELNHCFANSIPYVYSAPDPDEVLENCRDLKERCNDD